MNDLTCGIKMWERFISSVTIHALDRQTDGQMDIIDLETPCVPLRAVARKN